MPGGKRSSGGRRTTSPTGSSAATATCRQHTAPGPGSPTISTTKPPIGSARASAPALGIPYVLAEASVADKQRHGPWHSGYRQSRRAIQQAGLIFMLNQRDQPGVRAVAGAGTDIVTLPPFLDLPGLPLTGGRRADSWRCHRASNGGGVGCSVLP